MKTPIVTLITFLSLQPAFATDFSLMGEGSNNYGHDCAVEIETALNADGRPNLSSTKVYYTKNQGGVVFGSADRPNDRVVDFSLNPLRLRAGASETAFSWDGMLLKFPRFSRLNGEIEIKQLPDGRVAANISWSQTGGPNLNETCILPGLR